MKKNVLHFLFFVIISIVFSENELDENFTLVKFLIKTHV